MTYGLSLGVLMVILGEWAPQPAGSLVLWTALTIQAAAGTWIIWRRLRLPWLTVGTVAALCVSTAMIPISARGLNLATMVRVLPLGVVVPIWAGVLLVPLCVGLESLRNSDDWQAWQAATSRSTLWDMLTFRHVPDLHSRSERNGAVRSQSP